MKRAVVWVVRVGDTTRTFYGRVQDTAGDDLAPAMVDTTGSRLVHERAPLFTRHGDFHRDVHALPDGRLFYLCFPDPVLQQRSDR